MRRRGFSLIEMLLSIGIGTVAMGGAVVVIDVSLRMDELSRQQSHATAVVGRLSSAFRNDVHRARQVRSGTLPLKSLLLVLADETAVDYRLDHQGVVRTEAAAGKANREELFMLPADTTVELSTDTKSNPVVGRLRIVSAHRASLNLVIEAIANRHADLETGKTP